MKNKMIVMMTLLLLVLSGTAASGLGQVSFKESPPKIEVNIGGKPFTTFYYGGDFAKPFLHPLRTASGLVVTRGYPLEKVEGESNDHFWHRGLWFAHGDINFSNGSPRVTTSPEAVRSGWRKGFAKSPP